ISDVEKSIISFVRYAEKRSEYVIFVCNFTPTPREAYSIGVPERGYYREILNSDADIFGGSNMGNGGGVMAEAIPHHHRPCRISITIPPLAVLAFKRQPD
ncbi:MAG TPA: alpha amylase C-terminal domain-containing protein, partial [Bryobacteraceae bacterium]|nr:alpha amylase C-terminal domain-containing protein [Bryobacteraceae bacterium]